MRRRRPAIAIAATAVIAAALAVAAPQAAQAHDELTSSTPASGDNVTTELKEVSLTFNEELLDVSGTGNAFAIQLRGPGDRFYETACPALKEKAVAAPVRMGDGGVYQVKWQIVSKDGHVTTDSYKFTYTPPSGLTPAKGNANALVCKDGQRARPVGAEQKADQSASMGVFWGVLGILLVPVLALAIAMFVIFRRRRARSS